MSNRIQLIIAYDGAAFAGWQSQAHRNSAQDHVEAAASKICKRKVTIHGAGRTDSGVHAVGQSAHFDAGDQRLPAAAWVRAFNANLPQEIRVMRARPVAEDFHARFSAVGKTYQYHVVTTPVLRPDLYRRAWHVPVPMDHTLLAQALAAFEGRHDFRSFSANRGKRIANTTRTIQSITCRLTGTSIKVTIRGDGFLYKMVRILVASAVRVAQGKESGSWIGSLLANPEGPKSTQVAPADGLTLQRVFY